MEQNFKEYLCVYRYSGEEWGVTIQAESFEDAKERLQALSWGRVEGERVMKLPGWLPAWSIRLFVAFLDWRNGK